MRRHGALHSAADLGLADHACWAFADDDERRAAGTRYLADGRRLGQRLVYVGNARTGDLRADLHGLEGRDALLADGALELRSLPDVCQLGRPIDPDEQLAVYAAETDRALADGYTGLRILAEVTALMADPALRPAHARWEAMADAYMADHPMSALCCYDRREVADADLADVACVHPLVHGPEQLAPFRLFARPGGLALEGEVDFFTADVLDRLLALATRPDVDAEADVAQADVTELDVAELGFADHRAVRTLARHGGRFADGGGRLRLLGASPSILRLARTMGLAL